LDDVERGRPEFTPEVTLEDEARGRSNRTRLIILVLVAGLALAYMVYAAFPGNALFFLSVDEFMAKSDVQDGRVVRVAGKLVDGTFVRDGNSTLARFQLVDKDGGPQSDHLLAKYEGVVPDLFFNPHSEIILQGSYGSDQVFTASTILVKCPSKYRSLEDELESTS
jgi:cytochrome c-type biogenesis protein CcmE